MNSFISLIVVLFIGYLPFRTASAFALVEDCKGPFRAGQMPRKSELDKILINHKQWLSEYGEKVHNTTTEERADDRRANLCNANLRPPVNLKGIDLSGADLRGADFQENDLSGLIVRASELQFANLQMTTL